MLAPYHFVCLLPVSAKGGNGIYRGGFHFHLVAVGAIAFYFVFSVAAADWVICCL
jgi:hypothetical protein